MLILAIALAAFQMDAAAQQEVASGQAVGVTQAPPAGPGVVTSPVAPLLAAGTPVRLMVIKEMNSRTAHIGDRFKLRVDEPIFLDGKAVVPVGAVAWGEIANVEQNGAVGKGGRLGARLLYLDLPSGKIPLRGEYGDRGEGNGAGVVLAVVGFGLLGLITGGDSARLKAGDTFTGYVDEPPLDALAGS